MDSVHTYIVIHFVHFGKYTTSELHSNWLFFINTYSTNIFYIKLQRCPLDKMVRSQKEVIFIKENFKLLIVEAADVQYFLHEPVINTNSVIQSWIFISYFG